MCKGRHHRVTSIDAQTDASTLIAGTGEPNATRYDPNDIIIVVDADDCAVRRINARTSIVAIIAGVRQCGGRADPAGLFHPHGCGINVEGDLYSGDMRNHRVRGASL